MGYDDTQLLVRRVRYMSLKLMPCFSDIHLRRSFTLALFIFTFLKNGAASLMDLPELCLGLHLGLPVTQLKWKP